MKTQTKQHTLCVAIALCSTIYLGGCAAGTSQDVTDNELPKSESQATTTLDSHSSSKISLKDVAQRANYICRATITDVRSAREQYDPQVNMVMSRVSINITKVYKGDPGTRMTFRAFGGELDGLPYYPSHFPQFHAGEDVILFLGDFNGGVFTVEHVAGKYTVINGRVTETGKTVEEFENEIKSSL